MTEYVVVTGLVSLGASAAIVFAAYIVAGSFAAVRNYVLFPFP